MLITVLGTHEYRAHPELARVHVVVEHEALSLEQATQHVRPLADQLSTALRQLAEAQPTGLVDYAVYPISTRTWFPYGEQGRATSPRHAASVLLEASFADFNLLADFSATWAAVSGIEFQPTDWELTVQTKTELADAALALAVADASRRAQVIATAAGLTQIRPVEIGDPLRSDPGWGGESRKFALAAAPGADQVRPAELRGAVEIVAKFEAS